MIEEVPPFWWRSAGWQSRLLWPVSLAVGRIAARRLRSRRKEAFELPVLCVAAPAIGAAGRSEVAIALAREAKRLGRRPGLIVAGASAAPHRIDAQHDLAKHVGDEALQLARTAPTIQCGDRIAAARALAAEGCDIIIIADGQVGEKLLADRTLLVADAARGIGNGHVVPAGPIRAPLVDQFRQVDAVLKVGGGNGADRIVRLAARAGRPVYEADLKLANGGRLKGRRLLAFAGTVAPEQFFDLIRSAGGEIEIERTFVEGHLYADDELQELSSTAAASDLDIATTARDAARLRHGSEVAAAFHEHLIVLDTEVAFQLSHVAPTIIRETVEEFRRRQLG